MHSILLALLLGLLASVGVAQDWGNLATISATMGVSASRVCIGEGSRQDIGCPSYAPSVTTAGGLIVSGTVSASAFIGDGSGLTGISTQGDRIISGSLQALAISNTGYISLTTGGTNWGYLSSGVNYLPTLKTNTLSASSLIQVGSNALTCAAGISGSMRYSATSSTMEYCNGSAWVSMGPSSTEPVAFLATKSGTNQTVATSTYVKLSFATEVFDTNNNFVPCTTNCNSGAQAAGESRFTPTVPGKYLVTVSAGCSDNTTWCTPVIYKNGTSILEVGPSGGTKLTLTASTIVNMNGTTDYLEGYIYNGGGTTIGGLALNSQFSAVLLAPQGGGSGGTATPAGNTGDVQYNSGGSLAADTGNFTYSGGLLTASRISATAIYVTNTTGVVSATWLYGKSVSGSTGTFGSIGTGSIAMTGNLTGAVNISASNAIQVGSNALTCASGISGSMRYSATSSTMEYCNGTAWTSMGPSATQPVAFRVHKNGTDQTVTVGAITKLTWSTENFDTNNNFASDRFTATVPGKYIFVVGVYCTGTTAGCAAYVFKNGSNIGQAFSGENTTNPMPHAVAITDLAANDYVEAYAYNAAGTTIKGASAWTNFSGAMLAPQSGGGSGATPAGASGDIQYNSGGSLGADTGAFTYSSGLLTTSRISATAIYVTNTTGVVSATWLHANSVSGSTGTFGSIGAGSIAMTGALTGPTSVSSSAGGVVSATYGYFRYISATSGLGAGTLASLTDVSASSPGSGMLLRYNGTKWESVGASTALSTTTMVTSWPDALRCTDGGSDDSTYILGQAVSGGLTYYYRVGVTASWIAFTTSTGAYNSRAGSEASNCISKSISQLYAEGRAFNYIGTSDGQVGERIVSGTVSAVAEQTSGTVRVSGTLALSNSGNETCNAARHYSLRINPTTGMLQMCRP